MRKILLTAVVVILLYGTAYGQQNTSSVIVGTDISPGTSNKLSFRVRGEIARQVVTPRVRIVGGVEYAALQKTYRSGVGQAIRGSIEMRVFVVKGLFVSGGASFGRVSYPDGYYGDALVERAYVKHGYNPTAGAGYSFEGNKGWSVVFGQYLFTDPTNFDTVNGERVGNRLRGWRVGMNSCVRLNSRLCIGGDFDYTRLLFVQPYNKFLGTLHGNEVRAGVRIGILK